MDSDGEIISRVRIEKSLDAPNNKEYRIISEGKTVGGVVLEINTENNHNHLDLLFIKPEEHCKGIVEFYKVLTNKYNSVIIYLVTLLYGG